jgi:hypothetical protein
MLVGAADASPVPIADAGAATATRAWVSSSFGVMPIAQYQALSHDHQAALYVSFQNAVAVDKLKIQLAEAAQREAALQAHIQQLQQRAPEAAPAQQQAAARPNLALAVGGNPLASASMAAPSVMVAASAASPALPAADRVCACGFPIRSQNPRHMTCQRCFERGPHAAPAQMHAKAPTHKAAAQAPKCAQCGHNFVPQNPAHKKCETCFQSMRGK